MKTTCGIYLLNKDNELLIVHPTHAAQIGCWSVPKGQPDFNEQSIVTAMRELYEETGLIVHLGNLIFALPSSEYKSKQKTLLSFLFQVNDYDQFTSISCNSYFEIKGKKLPENDMGFWLNINNSVLEKFLHESQVENLKIIREWLLK